MAGEVEKLARPLALWHTKLKNWHADTFITMLTRKNEKLARFWYVGAWARGHIDHAGTDGTHGTRFSKLGNAALGLSKVFYSPVWNSGVIPLWDSAPAHLPSHKRAQPFLSGRRPFFKVLHLSMLISLYPDSIVSL